jgi:hypothetical protein
MIIVKQRSKSLADFNKNSAYEITLYADRHDEHSQGMGRLLWVSKDNVQDDSKVPVVCMRSRACTHTHTHTLCGACHLCLSHTGAQELLNHPVQFFGVSMKLIVVNIYIVTIGAWEQNVWYMLYIPRMRSWTGWRQTGAGTLLNFMFLWVSYGFR